MDQSNVNSLNAPAVYIKKCRAEPQSVLRDQVCSRMLANTDRQQKRSRGQFSDGTERCNFPYS